MANDLLGDSGGFPGPNPLGVYLNGVGLPIAGGGYTTEQGIIVDITSTLHCGLNHLYVYDRDAGCGVPAWTLRRGSNVRPTSGSPWINLLKVDPRITPLHDRPRSERPLRSDWAKSRSAQGGLTQSRRVGFTSSSLTRGNRLWRPNVPDGGSRA